MKRDLKSIAKKNLVISELMEGRDKIDTKDIIKYYPNGITVNAYDGPIKTENGETIVYTFKEDDTKFAFGGTILQTLFSGLVGEYEGDIGELKKDLAESGLKLKLSNGTNSKGLPLTKVEIVD